MSALLRKYATATASGTHIGIPLIKAGTQDFATGSDYTPASGDCKISIDGGSQANITTLPAYTNGQWVFQLSGAETTGKSIRVAVVDSATKAVEDQFFVVETFGHASAMFTFDFTATGGKVPATLNATDVTGNVPTDLQTIKTQAVTAAAGVTFPASVASPTNITAGTLTTVTNLTNLPAAPTDWLTALSVKADAVTKIQAGLSTFTGLGSNAPAGWLNAAAFVTGLVSNDLSGSPGVNVSKVNSGSAAVAPNEDPFGAVVSATTTSVTFSLGSGSPAFNTTANAYAGTGLDARFLYFDSGANAGMYVVPTSSSVGGGNLTVGFAAKAGVGAATAGDLVRIK